MKKIVFLLLVIASSVNLLAAGPPPTTVDDKGNGSITVDVLKTLSIKLWCNGCSSTTENELDLPDVTIGTYDNPVTNKFATFIIEGSAGKPIVVTTDGPTYEDIADPNVTINGRWGSYDNGTQPTSGTFGAKPIILGGVGTATEGIAFCNYIVDKISAAPQATVGHKFFIVTVSVEYDL